MPQVQPDGWSQEQAERLQEAHRELLRFVQNSSPGTEAGAVYALDMSPISPLIMGEPGEGHIRIPSCDVPNIVIHNHPDGNVFSPQDIKTFIFSGSREMMTAVGKNGAVYAVLKTPEYDGFIARQQYMELDNIVEECVKTNDIDRCIQAIMYFLEGGHTYGLEFIKGGT